MGLFPSHLQCYTVTIQAWIQKTIEHQISYTFQDFVCSYCRVPARRGLPQTALKASANKIAILVFAIWNGPCICYLEWLFVVHLFLTTYQSQDISDVKCSCWSGLGNLEKLDPWFRRGSVDSVTIPWNFHGKSMDFPWIFHGLNAKKKLANLN